ncbi:MAG: efflux RND transporter periplasmic adaptor subunit [Alphaproteobacteria bacterium]|nr:efflux RND transporter periplasmic adaptor subunit [Alphaproteobacteria bacterium]MCB9928382.1 efflux RND transporter periplasmic adaptor subunit [Alphaproteobacteria bacterium]
MALLLGVLALALASTARAQRPALVAVDPVVREPLRQTQPIQGRFVARRAGPIAAQSRGAVTEMRVAVGDRVARGDVLAVLDTDRLAAEVEQRRATVGYRKAQLDGAEAREQQAQQEWTRMQRLRRSAAFNQARLDDLANAALQARLQIVEFAAVLETAKAELDVAELDLKRAHIVAPFDGVVSRRYIQAGAYVADGAPVVDLIDDRSLEIEADVPATRIGGLEPGLTVTVDLDERPPQQAVVRAVVPQENTMSRTRAVRFTPQFDPSALNAAAGAAATVRVPVGAARDVLTVHKDAVIEQGGYFVFVVEGGKAERKRVLLGESTGSRFVVLDGLEAGMQAVIRGNERLRPGQPVTTGAPMGGVKPGGAKPGGAKPGDGKAGGSAAASGKGTGS